MYLWHPCDLLSCQAISTPLPQHIPKIELNEHVRRLIEDSKAKFKTPRNIDDALEALLDGFRSIFESAALLPDGYVRSGPNGNATRDGCDGLVARSEQAIREIAWAYEQNMVRGRDISGTERDSLISYKIDKVAR